MEARFEVSVDVSVALIKNKDKEEVIYYIGYMTEDGKYRSNRAHNKEDLENAILRMAKEKVKSMLQNY